MKTTLILTLLSTSAIPERLIMPPRCADYETLLDWQYSNGRYEYQCKSYGGVNTRVYIENWSMK